jgi:hypothetical protein
MTDPRHTPHPSTTLPVRAAAKRLDYAPDYVARLCREGKLDCIQIGAAWFVRRDSLRAFKNTRTSERAARGLELSQFRRQQLHSLRPSPARPASALLPAMLLIIGIIACMTLSIFLLTIPIR